MSEYIANFSRHRIGIEWSGLAAVFVTARCRSAKQLGGRADENLRVVINGLNFREFPPEKNIQLFDIPAAFNGNRLAGLKQTIAFITVLHEGIQTIDLISRGGAHLEELRIEKLNGNTIPTIHLENQAEDGDRRPWFNFVLIDVPFSGFHAEFTIARRFIDSDDVKIIINGKIKKRLGGGFYRFWFLAGGLLDKLFNQEGKTRREIIKISEGHDTGIHYLEFFADRMPIFHSIGLDLSHPKSGAEERAENILKNYADQIKMVSNEFGVNPVIVGGVIYQEQSTNVNFVDTLIDYLGGFLGINTSIGIGQVRVDTAEQLEKIYPELGHDRADSESMNERLVRLERLKNPLMNIKYVAAKIRFSQDRWADAGFSISDRPDILGTLYNIESIDNPIQPNANPKANHFGDGTGKNYEKVKRLLEL